MKKVYVFGPIYISGESYLHIYKHVNKLCEKYFDKVIGTYPDFWDSKETPKEFYDRTWETIKDCDLFIAEMSTPSTGVGMELQMGRQNNIRTIGICKDGLNASQMAKGLPTLEKVIYYKDLEDLSIQLENFLKVF